MAFRIDIADLAKDEIKNLSAFHRAKIVEQIEIQLEHQPDVETRNRKRLENVKPGFVHDPPVWELRVDEYRVFYDVNKEELVVTIRAVRLKKSGQTTEDIIQ